MPALPACWSSLLLSAHLGGVNKRPIIVHALPPSRIKRKSAPAQPAAIKPARIVIARKPKRKPFAVMRARSPAND